MKLRVATCAKSSIICSYKMQEYRNCHSNVKNSEAIRHLVLDFVCNGYYLSAFQRTLNSNTAYTMQGCRNGLKKTSKVQSLGF